MQNNSKHIFGEVRSLLGSAPPSATLFQALVALVGATPLSCQRELVAYLRSVFASWPDHFCHLELNFDTPVKCDYLLAKSLTVKRLPKIPSLYQVTLLCGHLQPADDKQLPDVRHLYFEDPLDVYGLDVLASSSLGKKLKSLTAPLLAGAEAWPYKPRCDYTPHAEFSELESLTLESCTFSAGAVAILLRDLCTPKLSSIGFIDYHDLCLVEKCLTLPHAKHIKSLTLDCIWEVDYLPFELFGNIEHLTLQSGTCSSVNDFLPADFSQLKTLDLTKIVVPPKVVQELRAIFPYVEILAAT